MWGGIFTDQTAEVGISASEQFRVTTYGYFSFWHVVMIFVALVIIGLSALLFFRKKHLEKAVLISMTATVLVCMLGTLIWAIVTGEYNIEWFIPLHLCNVFGIILPICCFNQKFKKLCLDYIVWIGLGGFVAIIFPITSMVHIGVFHPVSIMVWVHHIAIAVLGGYYVVSGLYRKVNTLPIIGIIVILTGLGAVINHFTGSNFLFTNPDRMVQPMYGIVSVFGRLGVIAVISMVILALLAIHIVYKWFERRKHLTLKQFVTESWFVRRVNKSNFLMKIITSTSNKLKTTATTINEKAKNKTIRRAIKLTERFIKCVKDSEILTSLWKSELSQLTDADYLLDTFTKSGLLEMLALEFSLKELNELKAMPQDEIIFV
ncbi:MAG: YwaF family protein [Firmicutes bacterium]|nr:YwaF family protein [Bacillota bacterium]